MRPFKNIILLALAALLIAVCIWMYSTYKEGPKYAIVIDAGSSGSRLFIYEWSDTPDHGFPIVRSAPKGRKVGEPQWSFEVEPGLSSFEDKLDRIDEYLDQLTDYAVEKIGRRAVKRTPLYLFATGGLRSLDNEKQQRILKAARESLHETGFDVKAAAVLEGSYEGVFSWLSVNDLMGLLTPNISTYDSRGILEVGGASLQLTFMPLELPMEHRYDVKLGKKIYHLYSYSYDGYGKLSAADKWFSPGACGILGAPVISGKVVGSKTRSSFDSCKKSIEQGMKTEGCENCGLKGVYQPAIRGSFVALSSVAYLARDFSLPVLTPKRLRTKGETICASDWTTLRERYPKMNVEHLWRACFDFAYLATVLSGGYQNPELDGLGFLDTTEMLAPALNVAGETPSWTLGAMIFYLSGNQMTEQAH